jgi:hypothetical protein
VGACQGLSPHAPLFPDLLRIWVPLIAAFTGLTQVFYPIVTLFGVCPLVSGMAAGAICAPKILWQERIIPVDLAD